MKEGADVVAVDDASCAGDNKEGKEDEEDEVVDDGCVAEI